jgi:hypothetical protein
MWTSEGTALIGVHSIVPAGFKPGSSQHDIFVAGDPTLAPGKVQNRSRVETMTTRRITDPGLFGKC